MGLFGKLFGAKEPKPAPVQAELVPPVPAQLPRITAPSAAQIAQESNPSPAARQLLISQQTPSQYLGVLQEQQMGDEMVKTLAYGLPDREGIWWAAQSAQKVADHLPPADAQALRAALAWAKRPSLETQAAAAAAAERTDFRGPGAWAAQAAAWARPSAPATPQTGDGSSPRLTPNAVAGAVLLSSAIAANPQLASPKFQVPTLQAPQFAAAQPAAPGLAAPNVSAPTMGTPSLAAPNLQAPQFSAARPAAPGLAPPNASAPSLAMPNLQAPQFSGAPPAAPGFTTPDVAAPSRPNPLLTAPALPSSTLSSPGVQAPQFSMPQTGAPALATPNVSAPNLQTPALRTPQWAAPQSSPPPTVPPAVKAKIFGDQYPFIALGLDIAAGKTPVG